MLDFNNIETDFIDWARLRNLVTRAGGGNIYPVSQNSLDVFPENNNDLCCRIQEKTQGLNRCIAIHQLHLREIKKNLRPTIFRCHAGFWNMAIPLHLDNTYLGAVMGCGVLDQSRKSIDYNLLAQEIDIDPEILLAAVRKVPMLTKNKIQAFQALLYLVLQNIITSNIQNAQSQRKLRSFEEAILKYNTLYKIYKVTRSAPEFDILQNGLVNIIRDETDSDSVFIYLLNENHELLLTGTTDEYSDNIGKMILDPNILHKTLDHIEFKMLKGHPLPIVKFNDAEIVSELGSYSQRMLIPLISNNAVIGTIDLLRKDNNSYNMNDRNFMIFINVVAAQCATAFENTLLRRQTELLTVTDEMTGLYNFRYFTIKLSEEITRCARYGHTLSLIMIDIDRFKEFNDTFGHPAGDNALKMVAQIMKKNTRDVDIVARYGGEEFVIILPETDVLEATILIERIRKIVAEYDFTPKIEDKFRQVTLSAGIATFPHDAKNNDTLIRMADKALYLSKSEGRNRVSSYADVPNHIHEQSKS